MGARTGTAPSPGCVALSKNVAYRREGFGACTFSRSTKDVRFFDVAAAYCLEYFFEPRDLRTAMHDLRAAFADHESLEQFVRDMLAVDVLSRSETAHPVSLRHYVDSLEFPDTHLVAPLALELELTLKCRRRCVYCAYESHPAVSQEHDLSRADYERLFREARRSGVFYIRFTGGDPLTRADALDIIELADQHDFGISVASDLTLLTERDAQRLARIRNLVTFQTTLDGATPASADRLRGNGSFSTTVKGIRRLRELGIPVMVGTVLTTINVKEISKIAEFLSPFGVSYSVSPLYEAGRARDTIDLIPSNEDIMEAEQQFFSAVAAGWVKPADPAWAALSGSFRSGNESLWSEQPWLIRSPDRILRVDPVGRCYAGVQAKELLGSDVYVGLLGNLTLVEIWQNSSVLNSLRQEATQHSYFGSVLDVRTAKGRSHAENR